MVRHATCLGEKRNAYQVPTGKSEVMRSLGRYRHRWKNIKMYL
jgi:hypothetical protein